MFINDNGYNIVNFLFPIRRLCGRIPAREKLAGHLRYQMKNAVKRPRLCCPNTEASDLRAAIETPLKPA